MRHPLASAVAAQPRPCFRHTGFGTELDVARVDEEPEAAIAFGAAEGNFSGEAGAKKLQEVSAMRAESGVGSAMNTH